ncbi:hypothetical protein L3X38_026312 [Prunus dulcis]|uniref:Uncharacterized protein n=1 Tax=Prunus dulcis TaxID=3755 RepID=A0AAD4UR62_PRUDU|nr:hypothetical protein L3X38_026312 [Prunus dulcis]
MLKIKVELLGVTRMISKRFEEVLKVNDFHKVFRPEIIDVGLPKDMEGVKEDTVKRVVVILSGLYRSSGVSGAQAGAANPARIPGEYGQIFF